MFTHMNVNVIVKLMQLCMYVHNCLSGSLWTSIQGDHATRAGTTCIDYFLCIYISMYLVNLRLLPVHSCQMWLYNIVQL